MCLLLIARGKNISTLNGLVHVSKDVKYRDESLGGLGRTSHIYIDGSLAENWGGNRTALTSFHASELLVSALGNVIRGYDWWYVATGLTMTVGSRHGSHGSDSGVVMD